jgi:AcrR family transcriptional regulator
MCPVATPSRAGGVTARPDGDLEASGRRDAAETRERLLDAAERLFARHGLEGTSLRAVTREAGTSVSAANYHFGSKQELLRATLLRRAEPINRRRLEGLAALERHADGRPTEVEEILDAFLRPLFEDGTVAGENPARLVALRLFVEAPEWVGGMKRELFGEVSRRLLDALSRALPDRPRSELALALQFLVGIMVHVTGGQLADAPHLEGESHAPGGLLCDESVLAHTVAFVAAGLRARPTGEESR